MKKLKEASEVLFNIKLGNIHKTFSQIKARQKDPTKFLDTLKNGLIQKINYDQLQSIDWIIFQYYLSTTLGENSI